MSRVCEMLEQLEMFGDMTEKQGTGLLNPGSLNGDEGATPSVSSIGASFNSKIPGSDPGDGGATPPVPAIYESRCGPLKVYGRDLTEKEKADLVSIYAEDESTVANMVWRLWNAGDHPRFVIIDKLGVSAFGDTYALRPRANRPIA